MSLGCYGLVCCFPYGTGRFLHCHWSGVKSPLVQNAVCKRENFLHYVKTFCQSKLILLYVLVSHKDLLVKTFILPQGQFCKVNKFLSQGQFAFDKIEREQVHFILFSTSMIVIICCLFYVCIP